jgi:hypothetical protein
MTEIRRIERKLLKFGDSQKKNLHDQFSYSGFQPRGRVRIFERKDGQLNLLEDTSNLIVFRGRNWLMQRAFKQNLASTREWKDLYLGLLAVGTGATLGANPLIVSPPNLTDWSLGNHGVIGASANRRIVSSKEYHIFDTGYPKFLNDPDLNNDGSVDDFDTELYSSLQPGQTAVQDPVNGNSYHPDSFLVAKVQITLSVGEANSSNPQGQDLNEAGLFFVDDVTNPTIAEMFARVTFSTIRKSSTRELVLNWYIFF